MIWKPHHNDSKVRETADRKYLLLLLDDFGFHAHFCLQSSTFILNTLDDIIPLPKQTNIISLKGVDTTPTIARTVQRYLVDFGNAQLQLLLQSCVVVSVHLQGLFHFLFVGLSSLKEIGRFGDDFFFIRNLLLESRRSHFQLVDLLLLLERSLVELLVLYPKSLKLLGESVFASAKIFGLELQLLNLHLILILLLCQTLDQGFVAFNRLLQGLELQYTMHNVQCSVLETKEYSPPTSSSYFFVRVSSFNSYSSSRCFELRAASSRYRKTNITVVRKEKKQTARRSLASHHSPGYLCVQIICIFHLFTRNGGLRLLGHRLQSFLQECFTLLGFPQLGRRLL